jgi:4-diphosphocytidyl-2-C-methyl-D-erythritol kinase
MTLHVRAPAKLNLFLNVVGRRPDGYHEIDSLFAFCGLADEISIQPGDALAFGPPAGPFGDGVEADERNLAMRAAALLRAESGAAAGAGIALTKSVPVAAGLGGGSADAAATLLALNRFWGLNWPLARLESLAAALGADVPACLRTGPVYARGIGERLEDAPPLPACGILLVNPRVATPTPAVFRAFRERNPIIMPRALPLLPDRFEDLPSLVAAIRPRGNDLLPAAIAVTPVIATVLEALHALPESAHSGLSGSGATCFALFETVETAKEAEARLLRDRPGWWTWAGGWFSAPETAGQ